MSYLCPVDLFALDDARGRLVKDSIAAGRTPEQADVFVSAILRQVARAWGLDTGSRPVFTGPGMSVEQGLELRRMWAGGYEFPRVPEDLIDE